jgi:hypothetical protein
MRKTLTPLVLCLLLPLSACVGSGPSLTLVPHAAGERPATVDPGAAAAMISEFRKGSGLAAVSLDPQLTAIAAKHAQAMAAADKLAHVLPGEGSFPRRLSAGGYNAAVAAENIGAGYHNLNEAFAGWRVSPLHKANLLNKDVTRIGIAVAYNGKSKFRDYWSLVLARPDDRKMAEGPSAGPAGPSSGQ